MREACTDAAPASDDGHDDDDDPVDPAGRDRARPSIWAAERSPPRVLIDRAGRIMFYRAVHSKAMQVKQQEVHDMLG